jgi:Flp pilus assembly protein CpaB
MQLATKVISSKRGAIIVAASAALLAGILILLYLNSYRSGVKAEGAPVTVLIAKEDIPKGTSGSLIASSGLLRTTTMRQSQLRDGAFSDPTNLNGKATTHEIYRGSQLTATDFGPSTASLSSELSKHDRILAVPLDTAHGLIGELEPGNHVDIYAGFTVTPLGPDGTPISGAATRAVLKRIVTDVPVVRVASKSGGIGTSTTKVLVKVSDKDAADLAFSSEYGKVWLALRPGAGAESAPPDLVTLETLLLGAPPIAVLRSLRGHR